MVTFCGPEKEDCAANQTLRDQTCLVPCSGLYADIQDNSLKHTMQAFKQDMMTGRIKMCLNIGLHNHISGFHMLSNGVKYWKSGYQERLQQMFPTSSDEEIDEVKSFTESYHKYKRDYVRHLGFNPEEENLSRRNLNSQCSFASTLEHAPLQAVYIYFDTATYGKAYFTISSVLL